MTPKGVLDARAFAIRSHGTGQMWGNLPYSAHLDQVAATLSTYGYTDPQLLAAAYLHDVLEDTVVTKERIADRFGETVADLVWAVTGVGANRRERTEDTLRKLPLTLGAVPLKMADRFVNIRFSVSNRAPQAEMYRKEMPKYETLFAKHNPNMFRDMQELFD